MLCVNGATVHSIDTVVVYENERTKDGLHNPSHFENFVWLTIHLRS